MILIEDKHKCCGCESCVQSCPKRCIAFVEDDEGFMYPQVDSSKCVNCGVCEEVCPVIQVSEPRNPIKFYASKNCVDSVRMASSSGGVFTLLAESVISQGGVVFGARFDDNWEVIHSYTETIDGIADFRTSKYVQSRIGNSFSKARFFLKQGRMVLFSGTSCHIAALKLFLHREYDNLLTVDVICHGVPSPKVWRMYLEAIKGNALQGENSVSSPLTRHISEEEGHSEDTKIMAISFRDKRLGWKKFSFALTLAKASADGKKNTVSLSYMHKDNPYMKSFLCNINLRPSCFNCPSKGGRSGSDITLGDYWGIDSQMPNFDDDKGVGLVIINTTKGQDLYHQLTVENCEVSSDALVSNPSFYKSVNPNCKRSSFFKCLCSNEGDFITLMNSFSTLTIWERIYNKMKRIIKILM